MWFSHHVYFCPSIYRSIIHLPTHHPFFFSVLRFFPFFFFCTNTENFETFINAISVVSSTPLQPIKPVRHDLHGNLGIRSDALNNVAPELRETHRNNCKNPSMFFQIWGCRRPFLKLLEAAVYLYNSCMLHV